MHYIVLNGFQATLFIHSLLRRVSKSWFPKVLLRQSRDVFWDCKHHTKQYEFLKHKLREEPLTSISIMHLWWVLLLHCCLIYHSIHLADLFSSNMHKIQTILGWYVYLHSSQFWCGASNPYDGLVINVL